MTGFIIARVIDVGFEIREILMEGAIGLSKLLNVPLRGRLLIWIAESDLKGVKELGECNELIECSAFFLAIELHEWPAVWALGGGLWSEY